MLEPSHFHQGAGGAVSEMLRQLAKVTGPEDMDVSGVVWSKNSGRGGGVCDNAAAYDI
jgi:hypothetical protein